jgi:hypothetical protein
MATQDTCEFTQMMMMNKPSEDGTPTQLRSGIMRSSVLIHEYIAGDGHDKGLAWCLFGRKEEERQAWMEMVPERYVRAAACSLVRDMAHFEANGCKGRTAKAVLEKLQPKKTAARSKSAFELNPVLPAMLRCGLRRTVLRRRRWCRRSSSWRSTS